MEKRIIIISAAAPPTSGSHATRIAALVEGFASLNVRVTLLTCIFPGLNKQASSLYRRIESIASIIETKPGFLRTAATLVTSGDRAHGAGMRYAQRLRVFVRRHMFPDTFISWVPGAVLAAVRHIRTAGADAVLSSGAPFSSHIAAYLVSKICGVPLILDYGDPWVLEPGKSRRGFRLFAEKAIERRILRRARLASFTTQPTVDLYKSHFRTANPQYYLLPMGFDRSDYLNGNVAVRRGHKLTIVYAGRINEEYRTLDGLIGILKSELCRSHGSPVEFVFYGAEMSPLISALSPYLARGLVRCAGNVDHAAYIDALRTADGLLIFGNNNGIQIPGKIAHYLPAGKPILYFCNLDKSSDDPALTLLKNVQLTQLFLGPTEYPAFRDACESGSVPVYDRDALNSLEWSVICRNFASAVFNCVGSDKSQASNKLGRRREH